MDKYIKKVVKTVFYSQINKQMDIYSSELRDLITVSHFDIDDRYYAMVRYITDLSKKKVIDVNGYLELHNMCDTWISEQYLLYGLIVDDVLE